MAAEKVSSSTSPLPPVDPMILELQTAKEILAEVFQVSAEVTKTVRMIMSASHLEGLVTSNIPTLERLDEGNHSEVDMLLCILKSPLRTGPFPFA